MLERSTSARYASSVFYEDLNDFDIYIEDTADGYSKLFAIILGRILTSHISIKKVFPLGERNKVIEEAKKTLEKQNRRKSIFIVDGDLFLLTGERSELPQNTIRLPRYCIENFLIDSEAFIDLLDEECPNQERSVLKEAFNFEEWKQSSTDNFFRLFTSFAVSHILGSGAKTVKHGSNSICLNEMGDICKNKSEKLAQDTDDISISKCNQEKMTELLDTIKRNIDTNLCFITTYVSGKDFLLPLLLSRFRRVSQSRAPNILIKQRLARKCNLQSLDTIIEQMERITEIQNLKPN